jgi:ribosomal protein S18 acetylase RimI-like enzyme
MIMEIINLSGDWGASDIYQFHAYNNDFETRHNFNPHSWELDDLKHMLAKARKDKYFGVFTDGYMVAYGMLRGVDDGFPWPRLGLVVDKDYRKKGMGKLLLTFLETYCKVEGYEYLELRVLKTNKPAIYLYNSNDYFLTDFVGEYLLGRKKLNGY